MSRFSRESWRAELGRRSIELWSTAHGRAEEHLRAAAPVDDDESAIHDTMRALTAEHVPTGAGVAILVRDECARYTVVDPPVNARRPSDLRFAAASRLEAVYGDAAIDWIVQADWSATRRFLSCALPAARVRAAWRGLASAGRPEEGTTTEFVAGWNAHCRRLREPSVWVAHAGRRAVVLAACAGGSVEQVASLQVGADVSVGDTMAEIRRCALRWNLPVPKSVHLLGPGFANTIDQDAGSMVPVRSPADERECRL